MRTRMTFDKWMQAVDCAIHRLCGLTAADLDDYCYHGAYMDDLTADRAARRAIRFAGA